jgi:hypothetical protein
VCGVPCDSWTCGASGPIVWVGMSWLGQEHGLRRRAPRYHGATAGTLGPAATGRSHLLERVSGAMWMLLVLVPMAGKLGGRQNGDAAMTEQLQLRAARSCAGGLPCEGGKGEEGVTLCRQASRDPRLAAEQPRRRPSLWRRRSGVSALAVGKGGRGRRSKRPHV